MRIRTAGVWLAAAALVVAALGLALQPLQLAAFTAELSSRFSESEEAGLTDAQMAELAEQVRVYVVSGQGTLPAVVEGRPGFDQGAVSHLDDVRDVLWGANLLTGALVVGLAVALGVALARGRLWHIASALFIAAWGVAGFVALAIVIAVTDFDWFFAQFHALFFAPGTWQFPWGSLLIQIFPEPFWITGGIAWGLLCLVLAAVYAAAGVALRRRARTLCTISID